MYKIILDSCGDFTDKLKNNPHFAHVPLELEIDGEIIKDDDNFDQKAFLIKVKESSKGPKSACPSPELYCKAYEGEEEHVYVVTLSDKMSGSYNSAMLGASLYMEEHEDTNKKIHVFNSRSASVGETLIGLKVEELEQQGLSYEQIVEKTEEYIASMNTFFVLESLETLRKAGRLSNLKAFVANSLNLKPVMGATKEGAIMQLGQARGMKKALSKMIEEMVAKTKDCENKVLAISHCNCPERAQYVKECIEKVAKFKRIEIVNTAGISSMYANDGGIIMAV